MQALLAPYPRKFGRRASPSSYVRPTFAPSDRPLRKEDKIGGRGRGRGSQLGHERGLKTN